MPRQGFDGEYHTDSCACVDCTAFRSRMEEDARNAERRKRVDWITDFISTGGEFAIPSSSMLDLIDGSTSGKVGEGLKVDIGFGTSNVPLEGNEEVFTYDMLSKAADAVFGRPVRIEDPDKAEMEAWRMEALRGLEIQGGWTREEIEKAAFKPKKPEKPEKSILISILEAYRARLQSPMPKGRELYLETLQGMRMGAFKAGNREEARRRTRRIVREFGGEYL